MTIMDYLAMRALSQTRTNKRVIISVICSLVLTPIQTGMTTTTFKDKYMSEQTQMINTLLDEYNSIKQNKSNNGDSIEQITNDLNKITNNGSNVNDIFTNIYYINDVMEDKRCSSTSDANISNNKPNKTNKTHIFNDER